MTSNAVERRTITIHRPVGDVRGRLEQLGAALPGAEITGAPDGWGTEISVRRPSGSSADRRVRDELRRVKTLLEVGEVPVVDGQPTGRTERQERRTTRLLQLARRGARP